MTVGEMLNDAKSKSNLTIAQISDKLNISTELWSKIISGERRLQPELIPKICEILPLEQATILSVMGLDTKIDYDNEKYDIDFNIVLSEKLESTENADEDTSYRVIGNKTDYNIALILRQYLGLKPDETDKEFAELIGKVTYERSRRYLKYEKEKRMHNAS